MVDNGRQLVNVGFDKGWLRLRWTYQSKRYTLTLGLPDSTINRRIAEMKAATIANDIATGRFDKSLKSYRPSHKQTQIHSPSLPVLFKRFADEKAKELSTKRSTEKYQYVLNHLNSFFGNKPAEYISLEAARSFSEHLKTQVSLGSQAVARFRQIATVSTPRSRVYCQGQGSQALRVWLQSGSSDDG